MAWRHKTIHYAHYRCLTSTIRTKKSKTFSLLNIKLDIIDGTEGVIIFYESFCRDYIHWVKLWKRQFSGCTASIAQACLYRVCWSQKTNFNSIDRAFRRAKTTFFTQFIFYLDNIVNQNQSLWRTYLDAFPASYANCFVDYRNHEITIPKRYPSWIALLMRLGCLASPM